MEKNGYTKSAREVPFGKLLLRALHGWRRILVGSLIIAVVFGAWMLYSNRKNKASIEANYKSYQSAKKTYDATLSEYESSQQRIQDRLSNIQNYLDTSAIMQINPYYCKTAAATYEVTLPETVDVSETSVTDGSSSSSGQSVSTGITNVKLYDLIQSYLKYIATGDFYEDVAEKNSLSEADIKELVTTDYDNVSGVFTVSVRYSDADISNAVLDDIVDALAKEQEHLSETVGTHTLTLVNRSTSTLVDEDTVTKQSNRLNSVTSLTNTLNNFTTAKNNLNAPASVSPYSRGHVIRQGIKGAVAGFVGGFILLMFIAVIRVLHRGTIFSDDELMNRTGVRMVGRFPSERSGARGPLDRWIEKKEMAGAGKGNFDTEVQRLYERIRNMAGTDKRILLVTTCKEDTVKRIADGLSRAAVTGNSGITFAQAPDFIEDPDSIGALQTCDAAVIVEKFDESRYQDAVEEIQIVDEAGVNILGAAYVG